MKKKRKTQSINSGAMADVAFLLLIFFMVATTMQREKTIKMKLPPLIEGPAQKIHEDKVLTIIINLDNEVMIEGEHSTAFIEEKISKHLMQMIASRTKPIINVKMHPLSNYQSYLRMLSDVKKAIKMTKEEMSKTHFDSDLSKLTKEQYAQLNQLCGIRIMETEV